MLYSTFPVREQGQKGDWNYWLKAVYVIDILNFCFDDVHDNYFHHEVKLMDTVTKEVFYDKLIFIYLEVPKFNKTEKEICATSSLFDKWMFVLRNLSRLMERPAALQERVFTKLFEAAEIAHFTKKQYDEYEDSLKVYRDWKNVLDTAEKKAKEKGLAEGRAEGRAEAKLESARKGFSVDDITEITGLDRSVIEREF